MAGGGGGGGGCFIKFKKDKMVPKLYLHDNILSLLQRKLQFQ